jgi:cellobiose-specific phosphotransferase system component IIA
VEVAIDRLAAEVTTLASSGRTALISLVSRQLDEAEGAVADGDRALIAAHAARDAVARGRAALPIGDDLTRFSTATRERLAAIDVALREVEALDDQWAVVAAATVPTVALLAHLEDHDRTVVEAAAAGREERFDAALDVLDTAEAELASAARIRDRLAATVDVSTLDGWIARARDYDRALVSLYEALRRSGGEVTPEVVEANEAVERAQAALPLDTSALVVIVSDISRAGLTEAIIAIERTRAAVAAAAAALD